MKLWIQTPIAHALGWALVQFLWEGAAVAATLWLALALGGGWTARRRYTAAALALAALPVVFALTVVLAPGFYWTASGTGATDAFAAQVRPGGLFIPLAPPWDGTAAWITPVWMAGVLLFCIRGAGGWIAALRWRGSGIAPAEPEWLERFDRLRARLRVSRFAVLLESCRVRAPVVVGVLRPAVLVPAGFLTALPPGQVEAILIHELEHVRRFDFLMSVAQGWIEALLFYHPAVWWVSAAVREEREHCCDDAVLEQTGDARAYATALTNLEEVRLAQSATAANGGNLMRRVRRLLNVPNAPRTAATPAAIATILALVAAGAVMAWPRPQVQTPYQKWLDEDVVYIIAPEERRAFEALQTDAEREHFIEQFWERRDPTPGTPRNEFKEEHYRRIAYANEKFATGTPGWKSDRGRIYIRQGPPDEIESHADQERDVWLYHNLEGIGRNIQFEFAGPERKWTSVTDAQGRKIKIETSR